MDRCSNLSEEGVTIIFLSKDFISNSDDFGIPRSLILFTGETRFIKYLFIKGIHTFTVPAEVSGIPRIFIVFSYSKQVRRIIYFYNAKFPTIGYKPWNIFSISRARVENSVSKVLVIVLNSRDLLLKLLCDLNKLNKSNDLKYIIEKISNLFDSWYMLKLQKRGGWNFFKSIFTLIIKAWHFPPSLYIDSLQHNYSKVLYRDILNEPYFNKMVTSIGEAVVGSQQLYAVLMALIFAFVSALPIILNFLNIPVNVILSGILFGLGLFVFIVLFLYTSIIILTILILLKLILGYLI